MKKKIGKKHSKFLLFLILLTYIKLNFIQFLLNQINDSDNIS